MALLQIFNPVWENPVATSLALLCLLSAYVLRVRLRPGLRSIPGPFLASITNWYRLFDVWGWRAELSHQKLHKVYGDFVRYGPNVVLFGDPKAVPVIYGINNQFYKSEFYSVQQRLLNGEKIEGIFDTSDESFHRSMKRPISRAYAMTTLIEYEPLVDSTSKCFIARLKELYADRNQSFSLDQWLQWYAFDVIGEITFSRRLGFLDQAKDIGDIISNLDSDFRYNAVVGQMPFLDQLLKKNPIAPYLALTSPTSYLYGFSVARIAERLSTTGSDKHTDFLTKFLSAQSENRDKVSERYTISLSASNVAAGSDTTSISLSALFYYLLKNPSSLAKLIEEVDYVAGGVDNSTPVSWAKAQEMKYLGACINEALRIHPAVGLPLERVVPEGGREICGKWFPEGTIVGANAWVIHQNKEIYGEDADKWRPERWLEAGEEQRKKMDRCFLAFGWGSRLCLGKNISLLEMHKVVPELLRNFEIKLAEPNKEWKICNGWFVKQSGLNVILRTRNHVRN